MIGDRRSNRFPVMCKSEYTDREILVIDMSLEGMKIKTTSVFSKKSDITFTLVLPTLDIIKISCDVVWEDIDENHNYIYGVHLNDFNPRHKELYASYMNTLKDIKTSKSYQYS